MRDSLTRRQFVSSLEEAPSKDVLSSTVVPVEDNLELSLAPLCLQVCEKPGHEVAVDDLRAQKA
jgi:hypothetical protein